MTLAIKPLLLLIEDNPGDARLVREALAGSSTKAAAFEIEWVDRLELALGRLDHKAIDLILLDLSLPDAQGLSTMTRIRAHAPDIPVVVLTGTKDEQTALQALQLGAEDYLVKDDIEGGALTRSIRYALERARTRLRLRQLNNRLFTLIDASPVAIVAVDLEEHVTMWNRAAKITLGLEESEISATVFTIGTKPGDSRFADLRKRALESGSVHHVDFVYARKDGSKVDLSVSAAVLRDEKGHLAGLVYLMDDVTDMNRMREALARSESRYRDLFENATDIVCTIDMTGRFTSVNKKAEEILGYSREELLGKNILAAAVAGGEEDVRAAILDPHASGAAESRELELASKAGAAIPLEVTTRVMYEGGQIVGVQAILRDIRERKRLQARLQEASKMDALGRLAGGVAHDFNNLLTVISGYSQLHLAQLGDHEPNRRYVLPILKASDRAAALSRQLLAFSKRQVARPQVLDTQRHVTNLVKMMGHLIGEDIELIVEADADAGHIRADPTQIEQLMMNLLLNARDAMPDGGTVIIRISNEVIGQWDVPGNSEIRAGEYVILAVTDTGSGMDQATQEHIFEPFFTTKNLGEGPGLGLALVYGVVKQNGGHISLSSEPGRGTTFKVYLPRVFEDEAFSLSADLAQPPRSGTETILVVEDEKNLRSLVETVLNGWGYTILTANNGQEALQIYNERLNEIDLVITDIVMPGMSGRELVRRIREIRPDTRFLCMSGYVGEPGNENALFDESIPYLEKPFTPSQLSEHLQKILDGS